MKQGKIFTLGLLVLYLLSATSALVLLDAGLEKMPSDAIGSHQTALIAAGERAEQKVFYLESAARRAVADAVALLYRDQREFFSKTEGDMHETLDCGTYLYQLWNNEEGSCFDETQIADAFSPHLLGALGRASSVYPSGAFSLAYTLSYDDASFHFSGETLEEPILLGLDPGEDSAEARATMGQYTRGEGILWPSTDDTVITSCFGPRISKNAASTVHHGVDIGARGMVVAARAGVVINDPSRSEQGTVWIQHTPDFSTRYLHLTDVTVAQGETVHAGQILGKASNVGCPSCGAHLHFEVLMRSLPQGSSHAYPSAASGWYALNPLCFFSEETLKSASISTGSTDSCLREDYPDPIKNAYCDEYGLTSFNDVNTYTQGSATGEKTADGSLVTTEDPALGPAAERPTTYEDGGVFTTGFELTPSQAEKFHTTLEHQHRYGWGKLVDKAAALTGVDAALIRGLITQESLGDPLAISSTGCAGIMQWCIDNDNKESSTAAKFFGSGAHLTFCKCKKTRAVPGSGCACTQENDRRLQPEHAIPAGVGLLDALLTRFEAYPAGNTAFALASYNGGEAVIFNAIQGLGEENPSWKAVARYLERHPDLLPYLEPAEKAAKIEEIITYVDDVLIYTAAWNGGVPLASEETHEQLGAIRSIGRYMHPSSFTVERGDELQPFVDVLTWSEETLGACSEESNPASCLLTAANEQGLRTSCEDPGTAYVLALYSAMRDCLENEQQLCACRLPRPPGELSIGSWKLGFTETGGSLLVDDAAVEHLYFEGVGLSSLRVNTETPDELAFHLAADETGLTSHLGLSVGGEDELFFPGWSVEKDENLSLLFVREEASGAALCAPVKRHHTFCQETDVGAIAFALTVRDDTAPAPVPEVSLEGVTVRFSASPSEDVAFYTVYAAAPEEDALPLFQVRGDLSFDASSWLGQTLWIAPVDLVGNEGDAVSIVIPNEI
jgi:murein DD-endopeptidase MepM/ murein hydrolase activator NlpD